MAGNVTSGQVGSGMVIQCRYAFRRHSSSHSGSAFLAEMKRTISSFRPLGAVSASMSVTKPYLYLSSARTCSTVSRLAAIQLLSCMHECFCRILPAATALLPLLLADGFIHARANLLADLAGQAEARQHHHLREADRAQGLADGVVHPVPVAAPRSEAQTSRLNSSH